MCKFIYKELICFKPGRYNYLGVKGGAYCRDHWDEDMVYQNNVLCIEPKCKSYAVCKYTDTKPLYCKLHKKIDTYIKPRGRNI